MHVGHVCGGHYRKWCYYTLRTGGHPGKILTGLILTTPPTRRRWLFCSTYCILYNTLFSREENFAKSEFEIFSREHIFANILFTRKYLPAKISSRENIFSRKYPLAKIFPRENIFPRIFSGPQIGRLVGPMHIVQQ